jgi:putative NAD(P)-binding protein/flavin-dependent amine oxidoreductase
MSDAPRVTVAGGGLAGMTAALRLAERGYPVTLYEQKPMLGGDLASRTGAHGVRLDVYPHMYLSWYRNFWRLLRDAGGRRDTGFVAMSDVTQLRPGMYPKFDAMTDMYSPRHMVRNLFSGVGPPADMFVFGYASIDLLAEKLHPTIPLENVSVAGFLQARPYMTERAARAADGFITMVWAIPSYLAAANDYRTYLAYSFADHVPAYELALGSAHEQVVAPLTKALERHGVEIHTETQVTSVRRVGGRVTEIGLEDVEPHERRHVGERIEGSERIETVDELVLAVPPDVLLPLAQGTDPGERVIEVAPRLAEVSRLRSQRIPIIHLFFRRRLRHIPPEPVGLFDSPLALAFTDISQSWPDADEDQPTVLSLSASNPYGLPGSSDDDDAHAILRGLAAYLDFDPGRAWGTSPDVDWGSTIYEPNRDVELFLNETGTDVWRPRAACPGVENLSFAGDFCANDIGMTTIESAVAGGLEAAKAIVERHGIGAPVEIETPDEDSGAMYVWLRYAWGPYALAAKALSMGSDCAGALRRLLTPTGPPPRQRRDS